MLISFEAKQAYFIGLASYRIYRESGDLFWLKKAEELQEKITLWSEQGSKWNFEHQSNMMLAEEAYSNGNFEVAKKFYINAISLAKRSKFLIDEALASELAAHFHLNVGDKSTAFGYYTNAYVNYTEWGALAKVRKMNEFAQETFGMSFSADGANVVCAGESIHTDYSKKRDAT